MSISKLRLINYRQYSDKTINFKDKLTVIRGRNGIGKTTIVEAIGFALFGSALQRGKAKEWIKRGEAHGGVVLTIDGFTIERSDTLAIVYDGSGNTVARNNTGIVQWVENTYGLTPDLYKTSFYIGQKDIGSFAALSPLERTKRVEKLLRIDRLDEIKTSVREAAKAETANVTAYQAKLENITLVPVEDLADELATARTVLEVRIVENSEYKTKLAEYNTYLQAKHQWVGVTYDLDVAEKQYLEDLSHNAAVAPTNKLINEKLRLLKILRDVNVLPKYFTLSEREIVNHENTILKFEKLRTQIKVLNCEPVEHRSLDYQERDIREEEKILSLNKNIPDTCPTCGQDWPSKATIDVDKFKAQLEEKKERFRSDVCENQAHGLNEQLKAIELPDYSMQDLAEASVALANKASYLRLEELSDVAEVLLDEVIVYNLEECQRQEAIRAKLTKVIVEPVEVDVAGARKEVARFEGNQRDLEAYKRDAVIEEEYTGLLNTSIDKVEELKRLIKFIDLYRKSFGANVIPLLQTNVSNIVNFLSEGKYSSVKINNDYSIEDFDFYSGSEQDSVSFALRLAISQVSRIGCFKTMLLDEVAASFDDEREQKLMEILELQDTQLIYITHGAI